MVRFEVARQRERLADQSRASLRAVHEAHGPLVITNEGAATARDVEILVDGEPIWRSVPFFSLGSSSFPRQIAPGASARIRTPISRESIGYRLSLSWDDDSGERSIWETDITG